jgi:hypothetical protein
MKTRIGFVSNSSSTSFVIASLNDEGNKWVDALHTLGLNLYDDLEVMIKEYEWDRELYLTSCVSYLISQI